MGFQVCGGLDRVSDLGLDTRFDSPFMGEPVRQFRVKFELLQCLPKLRIPGILTSKAVGLQNQFGFLIIHTTSLSN